MGVYKYDAINDELIPIAGVPSVPGIEDKVSTYTADATYWDTSPTAASIKPVTSGGIKTEIDKKLSTYAVDSTAWDAAPTTASTKPVISDGIKTQFDLVHNELSDVNNILGSKNILPNSATTQVINGITYTVAADGSINVNGTASADSILHIVPGTTGKLSNIFSKGGNYIISVGTTGTGVNVFFGIEYTGSTWDIAEWLTYSTRLSKEIYIDGTKLNNSSSYIESYIKVNSGTTVSNIKVYPMLRPSSVRDDTYVPYSKTNYELTTEISNLANQLNFSITSMNLSRSTLPAEQGVSIGTLPSGGVYLVSVNLRLQSGTFGNGVIISPCDGIVQNNHDYG
ncbi:MAG: hypothetical protein VZQ98_09865, partial [Bacteroidales bacterium]|nr:hypothetical protein [Bacteroidales bacterium]